MATSTSINIRAKSIYITSQTLVNPENVHLAPGLKKNFVKSMDKNGSEFLCMNKKCPRISEAKIKEGIFLGLQIKQKHNRRRI
jgi:hypothetical protein